MAGIGSLDHGFSNGLPRTMLQELSRRPHPKNGTGSVPFRSKPSSSPAIDQLEAMGFCRLAGP